MSGHMTGVGEEWKEQKMRGGEESQYVVGLKKCHLQLDPLFCRTVPALTGILGLIE